MTRIEAIIKIIALKDNVTEENISEFTQLLLDYNLTCLLHSDPKLQKQNWYKLADEIKHYLSSLGYTLQDNPDGTTTYF